MLSPPSQSLSARFGKVVAPRASEPWHCAQLFRYRRWPIPMAFSSAASCSAVMVAYLAYTGAMAARAFSCSASYWPTLDHFSRPGALPMPG